MKQTLFCKQGGGEKGKIKFKIDSGDIRKSCEK